MQENPTLIQTCPSNCPGKAPLILIHDGGGTTFSYHALKPLNRTVYAIHNPRFYSGRPWVGGIPAMAKVYVELIRSVVQSGEIILGGWSLGGLISLEIASIICQTPGLSVLGIVMIDSIYPGVLQDRRSNVVPHAPFISQRCRPEIKILISNMLKSSAKMVDTWTMPSWARRPASGRFGAEWSAIASSVSSSSKPSPQPSETHSLFSSSRGSSTLDLLDFSSSCGCTSEDSFEPQSSVHPPPPRTILLRCNEYVPVPASRSTKTVSRVDVARECPILGWEKYHSDLIHAVVDIPGHHFNIFAEENINLTGGRIIDACDMLERAVFDDEGLF